MHGITLFPLGNADCCRVDLECGRQLLIDYAAMRDPSDPKDARCDLAAELSADLKGRGRHHYDVVAFTHLDQDHLKGATEFFHLDHARKYQGHDRVKIKELWVPAALITEPNPDDPEARILQREARHRFKEKRGVRVFSRPERLKDWCDGNAVDLSERLDLITDAGSVAPGFSLGSDGVEFFVHSPFAFRQDENTLEDRNGDCLVLHARFQVGHVRTQALFLSDVTHEALSDIVAVSVAHGNTGRLEWDIAKLPHHCSYLALGPEKGKDATEPTVDIARLYEKHGQKGAILVSTSARIPSKGRQADKADDPPHRQAAEYYRGVAAALNGEFVVTMEHPSAEAPQPLVIEIGSRKATLRKRAQKAAGRVTSQRAPRAGNAS